MFYTKLEVSTAFLLRENRRHVTDGQTDRRTDGLQHLMRPSICIITLCSVHETVTISVHNPFLRSSVHYTLFRNVLQTNTSVILFLNSKVRGRTWLGTQEKDDKGQFLPENLLLPRVTGEAILGQKVEAKQYRPSLHDRNSMFFLSYSDTCTCRQTQLSVVALHSIKNTF